MRRNPLVTFVSRCFIPPMSPVQGIHLTTSRPTRSTSTTRFASSLRSQVHNDTTKPTETTDEPPVLLLEGDNFQVSHDGVARTFYRLANRPLSTSSSGLGIEEYYDLKGAHKTFVLREGDDPSVGDVDQVLLGRQAQGLAPMGRALGHVEIQEIDEGVFGSAGTGATTWESSLVMGLFFADYPDLLRGALLEIGSGVGVGAILSHMAPLVKHHGPALRSVTLTDGNDECLRQCRQNIHQAWNELASLFPDKKNPPDIQVCKMDWNEDSGGDAIAQEYDTIIACDVCYLYPDIAPLVSTIRKLLGKDGKCHLFGPCKWNWRRHWISFIYELCTHIRFTFCSFNFSKTTVAPFKVSVSSCMMRIWMSISRAWT